MRYPPQPEPRPRRRRPSMRGQRYRQWRVRGPVSPVTVTRLVDRGGQDHGVCKPSPGRREW